MKKVILLGDSIRRIGYGQRVRELLGEDYTVWPPILDFATCSL